MGADKEKVKALESEVTQLEKEKTEATDEVKQIKAPEMTDEVKAKAEEAYEKYKKGELPEMSAEVKAAAEKAYSKLHGAGVVESNRIEKATMKSAQADEKVERKSIAEQMQKLGDDAPHAARAFQKFKQGAEVNPNDEDKAEAQKAWESYKASAGSDVDSASSAARAARVHQQTH